MPDAPDMEISLKTTMTSSDSANRATDIPSLTNMPNPCLSRAGRRRLGYVSSWADGVRRVRRCPTDPAVSGGPGGVSQSVSVSGGVRRARHRRDPRTGRRRARLVWRRAAEGGGAGTGGGETGVRVPRGDQTPQLGRRRTVADSELRDPELRAPG